MSYKLFTDKANKFQCTIQVDGTSLANSNARVVLETHEMSYLFKGKIYDNGVCEFDLPKLKGIINEGTVGTVRLEVIADDVYFEPWSSEFFVEAEKKVSVVVAEQTQDKKPRITMNTISLSQKESPVVKESVKPTELKSKPTRSPEKPKEKVLTKDDVYRLLKNGF